MKITDGGDFWKVYSSNLISPLIVSKDMTVLNPDLLNEPYRVSIPAEPMKVSRLLNHRQIKQYKDLYNFISMVKFKIEDFEEKKEMEQPEIKPSEKPNEIVRIERVQDETSLNLILSVLLRSMNTWRHLAILFLALFILTIILTCLEIIKR